MSESPYKNRFVLNNYSPNSISFFNKNLFQLQITIVNLCLIPSNTLALYSSSSASSSSAVFVFLVLPPPRPPRPLPKPLRPPPRPPVPLRPLVPPPP